MAPSSLLSKIDVFSLNLQQASYKTSSLQGVLLVVVTLAPFIFAAQYNTFGHFCILPRLFDVFIFSKFLFCFFCFKAYAFHCKYMQQVSVA